MRLRSEPGRIPLTSMTGWWNESACHSDGYHGRSLAGRVACGSTPSLITTPRLKAVSWLTRYGSISVQFAGLVSGCRTI
jgi:hypothetical protein